MKNMKKQTVFLLILCVLAFLGHMLVYPSFPEMVPTHWGFDGEVNGYSTKSTTIFLALLPLILTILFPIIPKIDPRGKNYAKHEKAYDIFRFVLILFLIAMVGLTDAAILGYPIAINRVIPVCLGIIFVIIGNYMPQIRNNYTLGIKTPWTLENEWVWRKTHLMGGIVFCIMGILFILSGIFPFAWLAVVSVAAVFVGVIWMYLYSYLAYQKWLKTGENS